MADQMSFAPSDNFISDAGLCDYLLNDLDDDPDSTDAIYAAVSATTSEHSGEGGGASSSGMGAHFGSAGGGRGAPKVDDFGLSDDEGGGGSGMSGGGGEPSGKRQRKGAGDSGPARAKTQAQIDRRRDRNRILARRTRLRKKFFFESLQQQVNEVERENALLKELVRTNPALADEGAAILATCTTALPAVVTENRSRATDLLNASDFTLMQTLQSAQRSFCITDPSLKDNPIVYASASFLSTTGYPLDEVIGKNCRFLQGPGTFPGTVAALTKGITEGTDTTVTILNYKKDGTPFWNQLFVASLRDINKRIVNYVGVQIPVSGPLPAPGDEPKPYPAKEAKQEGAKGANAPADAATAPAAGQ